MFLLDTNVVSELRKIGVGRADPHVVAWAQSVPSDRMFLSSIVIQELEIGTMLAERRDPPQGAILRKWLEGYVLPSFADRILPVDLVIARRSAALHAPNPRPLSDSLIAATALVHGMTVVTRNIADFETCGVALVNPWDAPHP